MDDDYKRDLEFLDDRLARIETSLKRVEASHQEIRDRIEKVRRAVKVGWPVIKKMIG
jgi:hypothetical protein